MSIGVVSSHSVFGGGGVGYATAVLSDHPIVYYRLGEPSGTTMGDSSGNSHPGTYTGSPTLGVTGAVSGGDTAATFSGSNYGDVAYGSYMDSPTALTLECWLKFTGTGLMSPIDRDTGFNRVWQWRTNAGHMDFIKIGGTGGIITGSSTTAFNNGAWHHAAVTYDGANIRLYLDGALDATVAAAGDLGTAASPLAIAASRGGDTAGPVYNRLTGSLDEVAVYNTALSGARIAAHYAAASTSGITMPNNTSTSGGSGSPSIVLPSGIVAGDILVLFVGSNYSCTGTAPSGWTTGAASNVGSHNSAVFYKVATGTESGTTVNVAMTGSEPWDAHVIVTRSGLSVRASYQSAGLSNGSNPWDYAYPSMSATTGDLLLVLHSARTGTANGWSGPAVTVLTNPIANAKTGYINIASTGAVAALSALNTGQAWTGVAAIVIAAS